jgi:hypothetical protein
MTQKFDKMLLIPIGISVLGMVLILFGFIYYTNQTENKFSILASMIEQYNSSMDLVISQGRNITHQYLLTENNISALSRQLNITSQNTIQQMNSLKESNTNLQNQIAADDRKFDNLNASLQNQLAADERKLDNLTAYVNRINLTCTCKNTTTIVYLNQSSPAQNQTASISCRQALMNKYGLGSEFDVVTCCNRNPPVGYWQECCACYQ